MSSSSPSTVHLFICDMGVAADTRRRLILLHRSIGGVEGFNSLYVRVLFDKGYESFERFGAGHGCLTLGPNESR
jgi:hypothetical protein